MLSVNEELPKFARYNVELSWFLQNVLMMLASWDVEEVMIQLARSLISPT
jgi:hypothetical protein